MATQKPKMTPAIKPTQKGGTGAGGTKGGKTNEQMLKLGCGLAKAAANGKAY
jgi:hypothetical protein